MGYVNSKRYKQANKEIKILDYPQAKTLVEYYALKEKNHESINLFAKDFDQIYTNYYYIFDYEINNISWKIYENSKKENSKINDQTFEIASNRMKLITSNVESAEYQDTYAHILSQLGKNELDVAEQTKAIEIAKKNNYGEKRIAFYEKELEKMKE